MRVLHVCADRGVPPDGTKGASVHLRSLAGALVAAGADVTLLAARLPRHPDTYPTPVVHLESPGSILAEARRSGPPDVIYERYALCHRGGMDAARQLGVPFVLEVNAPLVLETAQHRPGSRRDGDDAVERDLLCEADAVVVVSEPLRQWVADVRGHDRDVIVVRNGSDPGLFPVPAGVDGTDPATLVFLGHPKPWHGADTLPAVVAALRERGRDARLLVVGDGEGAGAVMHAAAAAGVVDHVAITGALTPSEAAAHLAAATVAVAPYPPQAFFYFCPLKVVESMMAGLPVVTTDQGDLPVILGGTGVVTAPGNTDAFVDAVDDLLRDPDERVRLGIAARQRALAEFTWDAAAREVLAELTRLRVEVLT